MLEISATPQFRKMFSKIEDDLQEEAVVKMEMLRDVTQRTGLKVYELNGAHKKHYSFSVNYKIRIVFLYLTTAEIVLTAIGDHDIYK